MLVSRTGATPLGTAWSASVRRRPADARGDAVLQVAFDRPDWFNGFEHDPEEAARVGSVSAELAATGEALVASLPSHRSATWQSPATPSLCTGRLGLLTACWG